MLGRESPSGPSLALRRFFPICDFCANRLSISRVIEAIRKVARTRCGRDGRGKSFAGTGHQFVSKTARLNAPALNLAKHGIFVEHAQCGGMRRPGRLTQSLERLFVEERRSVQVAAVA